MMRLFGRTLLCLLLLSAQIGVASGAVSAVQKRPAADMPCPHHAGMQADSHDVHDMAKAKAGCQHDSRCQCAHFAAASLLPAQPDLLETPWHDALALQRSPEAPALLPPAKPWRPPSYA